MPTRIIGLGNPLLSDDAAGLHVVRALRQKLAGQDGVELYELSVSPPRLPELFAGAERLIIVDSIKTRGGKPGTVLRWRMVAEAPEGELEWPCEFEPEGVRGSHAADLRAAFRMARLMGAQLPQEVWVFAVEAEDVTTFREQLTPAVACAVPALVEEIATLVREEGNR